jgi:ribosomal protein S18 acetylase RimI-like enzyme
MPTTATLRPIAPDDAERLRRFHARLSAETIYRRYHAPHPELRDAEIDFLVRVDGHTHVAVVACDEDGEIVGVCRVISEGPGTGRGEVAIVVADAAQHAGLGSRLLERTLREAAAQGIVTVDASVLAANSRALHLFHATAARLGLGVRETRASAVVEIQLDLTPLLR